MLKEIIEEYIPNGIQEEQDKVVMLKYLDNFDNSLTRDNLFGHFTASAFIVNKERTKVLMAYHNIYKSFSWLGGHMDGDPNPLEVAIKELKEESSLKDFKLLYDKPITIDALNVFGHIKNGKWVSAHTHLNITYLFEASEESETHIKEDENSDIAWIDFNDLETNVTEEKTILLVYKKIIARMKKDQL